MSLFTTRCWVRSPVVMRRGRYRQCDRSLVDRLRRARELLSAKGYDTRDTILSCYSGAGFDENLRAEGVVPGQRAGDTDKPMPVDLDAIYAAE